MKKSELYKTAKLFFEDGPRFAICGEIIRFSGKREDDYQYFFRLKFILKDTRLSLY